MPSKIHKNNFLGFIDIFCKLVKLLLTHPKIIFSALSANKLLRFLSLYNCDPILAKSKIDAFSNKHNELNKFDSSKMIKLYNNTKFDVFAIPTCQNPLVSIIIPVYNNFELTYNCVLATVQNINFKKIPYEIIIADDCSNDLTKNISSIIKNTIVIRNNHNMGFIKNINNAAKYARGNYIYLLNNDTMPQENFLSELTFYLKKHPEVGIVGSKMIYKNGIISEAGNIIWNNGSACNYANGYHFDSPEGNYIKSVNYISGSSLLIRKSDWKKINGLDVRYAPAYYDDSDLSFKIRYCLKKDVVYIPTSVVVHLEGATNGNNTSSGIKKYQITNRAKFCEKWKKYIVNYFYPDSNYFYARDLSRNKKAILVLDDSLPAFDKHAGGKTIFSYLNLFLNLNFNVKFFPSDKSYQQKYIEILTKMGIETLCDLSSNFSFKNYIKKYGMYFNYIFLSRPEVANKYIKFLKRYCENAKFIYYGHDIHFLRTKREYNLTKNKATLLESKLYKKIEMRIFKQVDLIYYPSVEEVNLVKKFDSDLNVKVLLPYFYSVDKKNNYNFAKNKNLLFVGNFLHKPNVDAVLWFIKDILPIIIDKFPHAKFHIVGPNIPSSIATFKSKRVILHGHLVENKLTKIFKSCSAFVAPLRYGSGVKGKIVEAMANGIAIVTTTIGAEGIPDAKKSMLIADTKEDFAFSTIKLLSDHKLKCKLIKSSKLLIKNYYSVNKAKKIILKDFKN